MNNKDVLFSLDKAQVFIRGHLGEAIGRCIQKGVMQADYSLYIQPFAEKSDEEGGFQGEFWGKWLTSAVNAYQIAPCEAYRKILDDAVDGILRTQESSGRISSYKTDFGCWDIWGRKYVMLGLIRYQELTGSPRAAEAACRMLDNLIEVAGKGKKKLTESGLRLLEGLSSVSILEPVVLIGKMSGNPKYIEFAEYLVSLLSEPNQYTSRGIRLIEDALEGKAPVQISSPKGYEIMSCYKGICELYRVTGNQKYFDAARQYAEAVLQNEIMIVGSGSSGELWCDGAIRQTQQIEQPMETCVTTTWLTFMLQMLRLTGDSSWADQMEITLYNAMLSAMMPGGDWWAYFTQLAGERIPSPMQVPDVHASCCVANGPRGLLSVYNWAVMESNDSIVLNLYVDGEWNFKSRAGEHIKLLQKTAYPKSDTAEITVQTDAQDAYTIALRIPAWSKDTVLYVNQVPCEAAIGTYARITRKWQRGDKIDIKFDMRGRVVSAPGCANHKAVMRGPVVLALDNRLVEEDKINLWLLDNSFEWKHDPDADIDYALLTPACKKEEAFIDLIPVENPPDNIWMAFEVPFLYRPTHFFNHQKRQLVLCDYASAGNAYRSENLFRVWMPQPMHMNEIFPRETEAILL